MRIILNNRIEDLDVNKISVAELIRLKNFTFRLLVTKINNRVVKKEEREFTTIEEGDEVLILHMISGG
jgi:sulfur carrier protein